MKIEQFTFNAFQENTYLLYDESGECLIVDPGMNDGQEEEVLFEFIRAKNLRPTLVVNTHCHIDHILGNDKACTTFKIGLAIHKLDLPMLERAHVASQMWGISYRESPAPTRFLGL